MKVRIHLFAISFFVISYLGAQTNSYKLKDSIFTNLTDALTNPQQVYKLRLINQHINTSTVNLSLFTNLQELTLSYDNLLNLPEGLEKLEKLTVLDISANNFTLLHEQLDLIPNLE